MANRLPTEGAVAERDRLYRLSMIAGSNALRDTLLAEHPSIVKALTQKQKGK